ncbi:pentatricopeptide repeat-containing protein [Dorcoceras hygrometricum]|uniref:Pentatricopeptide repeat-containing protein n=1 Tax=Dorcoceras hygrometricum TaxID=472368 RepID=A0A2Z7ADY5_9LAMI|nr:pentatricopeptide repeat-containing protein [Dorcoceras hygrometricum]
METSKVESVVRNQDEKLQAATMTSALLIESNRDSATMTSACLLEEATISDDNISSDVITISSCEEKRKSWISDDEVSSDVSNQQRATVQSAVDLADALCDGYNQQSQDDVPVASYSGSSRELQCFAYPVAGNPDVGKAEVAKNCNQAQSIQSSKKPDAVIEESTRAKQLTNYEELLKLDVNCCRRLNHSEAVDKLRRVTKAGCQLLSLFQILKTTKRPAKERTQRTIPIGNLKNTFEREEFVSNGFNLNRGLIYERNAIEEAGQLR